MSADSTIVNKYAKAAFAIAKKNKLEDIFVSDIDKICQTITPLIKELSNPAISKKKLQEVITESANKLNINAKVIDFLVNVTNSRRINILDKILAEIESLVKADKNIIQVEVTSSRKLTQNNIAEIKNLLEKKYNNSKVEISEEVKKEIIGGIIIKIGSLIIDSSIKNQLSSIYAECKSAI
jgi:F-type H+-transporting ATPase subunit delta